MKINFVCHHTTKLEEGEHLLYFHFYESPSFLLKKKEEEIQIHFLKSSSLGEFFVSLSRCS